MSRIEAISGRSIPPLHPIDSNQSWARLQMGPEKRAVLSRGTPAHSVEDAGKTPRGVEPKTVTRQDLETALETLARGTDIFNKRIQFRIHEETDRLMVQVVDRSTQEVIREIPPQRVLDLLASIQEFLGFLFDERV